MSEEKKELSIEEMKNLISLAALLPSLLDKIETINNRVNKLTTETNNLINHYNENAKLVNSYKESVDELINNMVNAKEIKKELDDIKTILLQNNTVNNVEVKETKKTPKVKNKEDEEVMRIVDLILDDGGRKRKVRKLTFNDVKNGFKADDKTAQKVLDYLAKKKYYDPVNETLMFPKRN